MRRMISLVWAVLLLVSYAGVVPIVVVLLQRALAAARRIERYTEEILASGAGIADNTLHVAELKQARAAAPALLAAAAALERDVVRIKTSVIASVDGRDGGSEA